MFQLFIQNKENITLILVLILFIWRIIDAIIKIFSKRNAELEKLAFQLAKIKSESNNYEKGLIISNYFHCLHALKTGKRSLKGYMGWCETRERNLDDKIRELEFMNGQLSDLLSKLDQQRKVSPHLILEKDITIKSLLKDFWIWCLRKKPFHQIRNERIRNL